MNKQQVREFIYKSHISKSAKELLFELKKINGISEIPCFRTIYRWKCRFDKGRKSLIDNPRSGRPLEDITKLKNNKIKDILKHNPYISIEEIVTLTNFNYGTVFNTVK